MLQHLKKFHKVHFTSKSPMAKCKVEGTMHHGGENGTEMTQSKKRYRQAFPSTSQINSGIVSSAAITDGAPCAVNICSHCPFFHTEQEKMLQHVEKFHPKKRSDPAVASDVMLFICPLCGKVTYSNDGLKAHMRVHAGDFKCHRCPRTFAAYTSLQRHLEDENGCKVDTDMGANEELLVLSDVKESPGSDLQCGTSKQISEENSETSTDSQHINVANDTDHLQCQEMKGTMSHGGETAAQTQSDERYKQAFPSSPEEIIDIIPRSSIPDGAPCTVHVCSHCPFFHTEPEKMLQHVEKFHSKQRSGPAVVSGGTIFMCPLCEKVMYSNDGLKAHIRIMHSGDFMCHRCPRTFAARTNLQRHLEDRNGCGGDSDMWGDEELLSDMEESPGQDSQCGTSTQIFEENSETSSDSYGGGNATEMTQSEERYEKAFPSSPEEISDIIIPRSSFPGGAPCTVLICSHCPFFHTEPETMRQHMKSHFNGEENATEMTTSSSSSESQIPQPQATATNSSDLPKSHQCPVCKRSFETAQLLSFHHEAFHVSQKGSRRVNSVQENPTWSLGCSQSDPCMCHICDAKFPHLRNVRQHYTGIHRFSGPFPCKHCGKTFDRLMELSRHQKNLSVQHKCGTCQKLFKSSDLLHEHKKVHSETVNQYLCDKCGKGLRSKMGWLLHQRLHRGERKWVCDICGQKFFQSSMLHRHMFDHTGERPYICTVCNKGFKASRDRDRHMSDIHTDLRPYKCDLCSRTFKRPLHLKRHQSNKSCSKYE